MKIRIGNDIRLIAKLTSKSETGDVNIHSVQAYIVNKTSQVTNRFPTNFTHDCYMPNSYNINCSGRPSYHFFPKNGIHCFCSEFNCDLDFERERNCVKCCNYAHFLAPVKATEDRSVVEILFPAEAQVFTGDYKLILRAKLYCPGFSPNNLKTVTVDYDNVFTLVGTSEQGIDTDVTVNVGDVDQMVPLRGDRNVIVGKVYTVSIDTIGDVQNITWLCNEPNVNFLQEDNNSVLYTVTELHPGQEEMKFEILALSADNNKIVGRISIFAHPSSYVGDVYANSADVNNDSGNIKINLNDGRHFNIDLSSQMLWHEGS